MKIYNVSFNDGGWRSGPTPCYTVVAESEDDAIKKVLLSYPRYKSGYSWASELKIDGYIIEVYDEKTYNRSKSIEKLGI
jgi:hypothetical protein